MVFMRLLGKVYNRLTDKSSSITSLVLGIINVLWIYLFDRFASGKLSFSELTPVQQWVTIANITQYVLILLLLLSALFGVIGIIKARSENSKWIIVAIIGILLGVLPLIICGYIGTAWFSLLFL